MASRQKYPQLSDADWLRDEYERQRKSCGEISEEVGCNRASVEYWLHRHGIHARGRYPGRWLPKTCPRCGEKYTPTGPAQRFCSAACRTDLRPCEQCGEPFKPTTPQKTKDAVYPQKFCSMRCRRRHWAATATHRYINGDGYVEIVPPDLQRRVDGGGYAEINIGAPNRNGGRVKEHRWVMEQRLGRSLLPHEEVHHRNGQREDNDRCPICLGFVVPPEVRDDRLHCTGCGWVSADSPNLELWTTSQPKGQRVEDKIAWAVGFLAEYGYEIARPAIE